MQLSFSFRRPRVAGGRPVVSSGRISLIGAGLSALLLFSGAPAHAQTTVQKHVSWNLDALVGHAAGPFALSFQLTDGSGLGNGSTTVAISGGGFSGFSLTDSAFFQFQNRSLSPSVGVPLVFDLTFTYTGTDTPTPDQFSLAVLDSTGYEVPTMGPADAVATLDVAEAGVQVATFAGDTGRTPNAGGDAIALAAPVITDVGGGAAAVPEPGALGLFFPALAVLVMGRRKLNRC